MGWEYDDAESAYWAARAMVGRDLDNWPERTPNVSNYIEDLRQTIADAKRLLFTKDLPEETRQKLKEAFKAASEHLNKLENRPSEPTQDVIKFEVQYDGGYPLYTYAAVRVTTNKSPRWYITGNIRASFTWHELFDYIESRHGKVVSLDPCVRTADIPDYI